MTLRDALAVSMGVVGRTGEQACRHALILMAESARALTKQAKATRPVRRDKYGEYVEVLRQLGESSKIYRWMCGRSSAEQIAEAYTRLRARGISDKRAARMAADPDWARAQTIGNSGLAKRSWMWGLAKLGGKQAERKPIRGTSRVYAITQQKVNGYIKENRLGYITKAMPGGWEAEVARRATDKIMGQARLRLERRWTAALHRRERAAGRALQDFFVRGLAA